MSSNAKISKKGKRAPTIDELLPKLDDGTVDYDTYRARLSQNMDMAKIIFGGLPPQALEIEEAILGACLIATEAFPIVQDVLAGFKNPFYTDGHNVIWEAMTNVNQNIDRLTVFQEMERMQKTKSIGGNPYYLVQLSEKVASAAHVESHARLALQTHLRRKLIKLGLDLVTSAYDKSANLFETIDEHNFNVSQLIEFNTTLKGIGMDEVMQHAMKATTKYCLMGSLIKMEEVAILFSGGGNGKSILNIQMADAISRGESLFHGFLKNEVGQKKVVYFDFELSYSDFKSRYTDASGKPYPFLGKDWFVRVGNDDTNPQTFSEIAKNMERILVRNVELHKPEVIFIDNITAMSNGSTADAEVVKTIMDLLISLKKKYKMTVIVLAHTPKRPDKTKGVGIEDLAGSALLAAYADSIFTIGSSKLGENIKYILHLKQRNGTKIYDTENVLQMAIEKEGAFLQFKTLEEPTGREIDHLYTKNDVAVTEDHIRQMVLLKNHGKSLQDIINELDLNISRTHVGRLIKTYLEKHTDIVETSEAEKAFEEALVIPTSENTVTPF